MNLLFVFLVLSWPVAWAGTIACALLAFLCGVSIDSAWADKNKLNPWLWFAGLVFIGLLIFFVHALTKVTNN